MKAKRLRVICSVLFVVIGLSFVAPSGALAETSNCTKSESESNEPEIFGKEGEALRNGKLQALLKKGLQVKLEEEEKKELEKLYRALLPKTGADGEEVVWDLTYHNDDPGEKDKSDLISLSMKSKKGGERLMWFHILYYQDKKDVVVGKKEKVGPYPAMRHEGKHAFTLIGLTEIRAVADHESYKSDEDIDKVILSFDIAAVEKM